MPPTSAGGGIARERPGWEGARGVGNPGRPHAIDVLVIEPLASSTDGRAENRGRSAHRQSTLAPRVATAERRSPPLPARWPPSPDPAPRSTCTPRSASAPGSAPSTRLWPRTSPMVGASRLATAWPTHEACPTLAQSITAVSLWSSSKLIPWKRSLKKPIE